MVSFKEEAEDDNKLKALNDILRGGTFQLLQDEEEFEQFVTRLAMPKDSSLADITHITGMLEESPAKKQVFQIRIKEPSALEYIEDEVHSIMSSAVKEPPKALQLKVMDILDEEGPAVKYEQAAPTAVRAKLLELEIEQEES